MINKLNKFTLAKVLHNNNLFYSNDNYAFFLRDWKYFTKDYFDTYAFCLMPNHFHFCVKTKQLDLEKEGKSKYFFSNVVKNFLSSYTQSLNKQRRRKGTLYRGRFKRIVVEDRFYFRELICYIHHNPIHHLGEADFCDWVFSSYNYFNQDLLELDLKKDLVKSVFAQVSDFYTYHEDYKQRRRFIDIEERVQKLLDE